MTSCDLWLVLAFVDDHEQKEGEGKTILPNIGRCHFANRISWCKKDGSYIYSNIHRDHKRLYRAITIHAIWSDTASTRTHLGCLRGILPQRGEISIQSLFFFRPFLLCILSYSHLLSPIIVRYQANLVSPNFIFCDCMGVRAYVRLCV